jgi:hypothetical protein
VAAAGIGDIIYAVGGRTGATFGSGAILGSNEVYDACTNAWGILPPMPIPVSDAYSTVAYNNRVYVFGGATGPGTATNATQIYDVAAATWSLGAPMPTARGAAMAGIIDGLIAVYGGYDPASGLDLAVTEIYDPASNGWSAGPAMPNPVSEMAQGATYDAGGCYAIGSGIFGASRTDVYHLHCINDSKLVAVGPRGPEGLPLALRAPVPNPSIRSVQLQYTLPAPGKVSFAVIDVAGRRVWGTEQNALSAGTHSLTWDGRLSGGSRAPAGVYFVHMASPGGERTARLVRVD